ncbi:MAG TPA: phosphatase [Candidatus Saccharimonas sp.]|nr:phosphatase [Candidatus Saccharimonas sp.]
MLDLSDLRQTLVELKLSGELNRNTPGANRQAIREMLARNNYWALEMDGIESLNMTYDEAASIMAAQLGLSDERFAGEEPPYIDPEHTLSRLITGFHRLEAVAHAGGRILFATGHPGSMLSFYQVLGEHFEELGATLVVPAEPVAAPDRRWLDDINGVVVLSDEGNLMHTHASNGMRQFVEATKPDIVMADHAFAVAAINAKAPTIAIFDVDDPAIPIMAHADPERIIAVPMNDNQTNTRTVKAAFALIKTLTKPNTPNHEQPSRHLHPRSASSTRA